jgi:hypothetical protein
VAWVLRWARVIQAKGLGDWLRVAAWGLKSRSLVVPNSNSPPNADEFIDVAVALVGFGRDLFEFFVEELGAFAPVDRFGEFWEVELDGLWEVDSEDFLPGCVVVLARHKRSTNR